MIKANDIIYQVLRDQIELFYIQPLIVLSIEDDKIEVTKDEETAIVVYREDVFSSYNTALQIMAELTKVSITESQDRIKDLKALLKETKLKLKNLK